MNLRPDGARHHPARPPKSRYPIAAMKLSLRSQVRRRSCAAEGDAARTIVRPGGVLRQRVVQSPSLRGSDHLAVDQNLFGGDLASIQFFVIVLILLYHSSVEAHPGEKAPRPRVTKNLGVELSVRGAFRRTAHRSGRNGHFRAQLDAVLNEFSSAFGVHHDEDHIGGLTANLESNAPGAEGDSMKQVLGNALVRGPHGLV